jgi:hypothetical protein
MVECRPAGCFLEQCLGVRVGQPGAAAGRVDVAGRQLDAGAAIGEEHRAGLAAVQQARQQPGRAGLPDDPVGGTALAADAGPAVRQVQVFHVQGEHLGGPRRGLVQQAPERPLAQADALAGEQLAGLGAGDSVATAPRSARLVLPLPGRYS